MTGWIGLGMLLTNIPTLHAASLADAVNAARGHDAGIGAAQNAQLAGRESRWQGLAGLLPRAQLEGSYVRQDQPRASYAAAVRRHQATATLTQPLFDVSRLAGYRRGLASAALADIDFSRALQQLTLDVADAYFEVLYQRDVLQAAGSARQAFQRERDRATAALALGDGTRTELDEAQANLDHALAREVSAQTDLDIASGTYRRLTGLPAAEAAPVAWECQPAAPAVELSALLDDAARGNLDVQAATYALERARADVGVAVGANLPVAELQASYGSRWSRGAGQNALDELFGTTSKSRSSTIGVTVTVPLFAGGAQLSATREAMRRRDEARDVLEDARRKAQEGARAAWLGVSSGDALVHAQQRALASADSRVRSTRLGRQVGLRTSLDELNAQQRYFESQRDLAAARYKQLRARLQLAAALGTLGDADVEAVACQPRA